MTKDILDREILPHLMENPRKKILFIGYMVKKLLDCYFGNRPYDDRDNLSTISFLLLTT